MPLLSTATPSRSLHWVRRRDLVYLLPQHGPKLIGNTHQLAVVEASWKDRTATGLKDFFQVHLAEMADLFFVQLQHARQIFRGLVGPVWD